jgi:hypothetical protein
MAIKLAGYVAGDRFSGARELSIAAPRVWTIRVVLKTSYTFIRLKR